MTFKKSLLLIGIAATLSACGGSDDSNYATCSVEDQNQRFFNYMKEDYFWADQLQGSIDPEAFDSIDALLEELRVPEDRYSYILTGEEYEQLYVNATYFGFGFSMEQISDTRVKIRFVYNGSPADTAGIERADELIAIDDVPVAELIAAGEFDDALGPTKKV